jgi:hypothetical protein
MNNTMQSLSWFLVIGLSVVAIQAQQSPVPGDRVAGEGPGLVAAFSPKLPADMVPNPPHVTCKGDQLTITADNSTMGSVFAAVHACIGVEIALPDGSADERTYFRLGPGPTREVLDALLGSSGFDYVIESSSVVPQRIMAVVVMARTKDGPVAKDDRGATLDGNLTMTPARRAWLASRSQARPAAPAAEEPPLHPDDAAPVPPSVSEITAPVQADATASVASAPANDAPESSKEGEAAGRSSDPATPVAAVATDAALPPASMEPNEASSAAKELQNKIGEMKQMFEQRKKMNTSPAAPPVPN